MVYALFNLVLTLDFLLGRQSSKEKILKLEEYQSC
jgi:hypothetical protein